MRFAAISHVGLVRPVNQDGYRVKINLGNYFAVLVADGMGGHQAGEVASTLALNIIERELRDHCVAGALSENPEDILRGAIVTANREVFNQAKSDEQYAGMGTTIVAALFDAYQLYVAHIGDSRAYLIDEDSIRQLTEDHSLVNELWKSGQLTEEEVQSHPRKNVLTRALGTENDVELDLIQTTWKTGDKLLLCSDGLTNMLTQDEIHANLYTRLSLEMQLESLLAIALERGGLDNITIAAAENQTPKGKRGEAK